MEGIGSRPDRQSRVGQRNGGLKRGVVRGYNQLRRPGGGWRSG